MVTTKGEATRTRILEAAVDQLVVGGVDNLNLDEILASTRTSKGQLFHYFPGGKGELLHTATSRQVERLLPTDSPLTLESLPALRKWFDGVIALHALQSDDDACEVAALAARAVERGTEDRAIIGRAFTSWLELVKQELEGMRDRGLLLPDAPVERLASLILSCIEGGAVIDKATGSTDHLGRALDGAFSCVESFAATGRRP